MKWASSRRSPMRRVKRLPGRCGCSGSRVGSSAAPVRVLVTLGGALSRASNCRRPCGLYFCPQRTQRTQREPKRTDWMSSCHCFPLRSLRPLRKNIVFQLLALCSVRAGFARELFGWSGERSLAEPVPEVSQHSTTQTPERVEWTNDCRSLGEGEGLVANARAISRAVPLTHFAGSPR